MIGVGFDFFSQPANVNIHAARRDKPLGAPHGVQQLIAREHAIRPRCQIIQQAEFQRRERHRLAVVRHAVGGRVDHQPAHLDHARRLSRRLGAAEQRFDTGNQFARAEWLCHVIVRAHFQPHDAVRFLAPGGQHQNRQAIQRLVAPDVPADFETRKFWQHQIEQQHVRRCFPQLHQTSRSVVGSRDLKSFAFEVVTNQLDDIPVVFNQ